MRVLLYIICALLYSVSVFSGEDLDSLKRVARITKNDTLRIQILKTVGEEEAIFRIGYWDTLRMECEAKLQTCADSKKIFFQKHRSLFINNVGYVADEQGDLKLAIASYKQSAEICREINDKTGLAKALNNIGSIYKDIGDVADAMDFFHQSLKIREEIKDEKGMAVCINNIGFIFFTQKDYIKALKYYHSGLNLLLKINNKQLAAISYNNIGLIYLDQKKYSYALMYFQKARKIQIEMEDFFNLAQSTSNLASTYHQQNNDVLALKFHEENLLLEQELNFKRGIAVTLGHIAEIYLKNGKTKEALEKAKNSFEIFQEIGMPDFISSSSSLLSKIYEKQGNYKDAFAMHVLHKKMSDSLSNSENKKTSMQKELQYEYEKKVAADSLKIEVNRKITEVKFKQEKTQRYALYGGVFVLICVAVFIFNRLQVTKKQNLIIENQKMEVELKNEEITHQKELVDEKQKEIIDSINYAKRIQQAVLTNEDVWDKVSKEHFILFKPKDIVSGDFYWAYNTPNSRSIFALADCTGHGVPGGFMSMLGNSFLNEIVVENKIFKADQILNKLRAKIINALEQKGGTQQKDGMDISLCVWNKLDNTVEFAGANNPLWLMRGRELQEHKADKMPIGLYLDEEKPFTSVTIQLQAGDIIYLSTDGYADQFGGPKGKKLKYKPLIEALIKNSQLDMTAQKANLEFAFNDWKASHEQVDDVSIIGIRV